MILALVASCQLAAGGERPLLALHRAFPYQHSDSYQAWAREQLGCDPCTEIVSQGGVRYIVSKTQTCHADSVDLLAVSVVRRDSKSAVVVQLGERVLSCLDAFDYAGLAFETLAVDVLDEPFDVVFPSVVADRLAIGITSPEEANRIEAQLLETSRARPAE